MGNFDSIKNDILSRLDVRGEFESLGVQTVGRISSSGFVPCKNPYKKDDNPSAGICVSSSHPAYGFLCTFNNPEAAKSGKMNAAYSLFQVAADFMPGMFGDFKRALWHYAEKTGVKLNGNKSKPPTKEMVERYQKNLTKDVIEYLKTKRGLTEESIKKYELGWSSKKERNTFPVYDIDGNLVNIRFHNSKKKPKTLNMTGYGEARLWGLDRLSKAPPGSVVPITEGEFDCMLCEQESGFTCVSPTNGVEAFKPEWATHFYGHHVVILFDCDDEGRKGVQRLILPAFKQAVLDRKILSIKVVWLFEKVDKTQKDFTDWVVKAGGSGEQLLQLINDTPPYEYPQPTLDLEKPIILSSFEEIDKSEHAGRRVTVPLYIYGENSEAYHAPTRIIVTNCPSLKKGECTGRDDWPWVCTEPIQVRMGERIQLASVAASDAQLKGAMRNFVCDKDRMPSLKVEDTDKLTFREVFAHQVLEPGKSVETNELIEKPVYIIGADLVQIGKYKATGIVHSHPRNQKPTMLIDTIEAQEEDWQGFSVEKSRKYLEELQKISVPDMIKDISQSITRIYERDDIHLGVLLSLCSPRWIDFPGDGKIRGWVSAVVIGDTGTGKSAVCESMFNHATIGYRVSGMTSSRTGITYACEHDERRGWRIKAGALLKMSRQALIIDEAQDLKEFDLKTMAEALDTGRLKIDRIQNKTFEAETRCFFSCNPRASERWANQRTMDSFRYGCQSLIPIYPQMMIRRLDLFLFTTGYDIKNKEQIYIPQQVGIKNYVTQKNLQSLIYFAWNLKPEQIVISNDIAYEIRVKALALAKKFGSCADLPICYPEDFRKSFCRLVVAYAVLDLSSTDDFQTITVTQDHIDFISDFLDYIYSADNCRLDAYSEQYKKEHDLEDAEELAKEIEEYLSDTEMRERICYMIKELLKIDPMGNDKINQKYFTDQLSVDRQTILRDMKLFVKRKLVDSSRGYRPTTKLIRLINWSDKKLPKLFKNHEN